MVTVALGGSREEGNGERRKNQIYLSEVFSGPDLPHVFSFSFAPNAQVSFILPILQMGILNQNYSRDMFGPGRNL